MKNPIAILTLSLITCSLFATNLSLIFDIQKNTVNELNLGLSYDYDNVNISLVQAFDIDDSFNRDCLQFEIRITE